MYAFLLNVLTNANWYWRNYKYLQYLLRHKWFVFYAGRFLDVSWYQLIIHDWTKFTPSEYVAYRDYFWGGKKNGDAFNYAWKHHISWNPHHAEFWNCQNIPDKYIREMVADWAGAGRVQSGKWEFRSWYESNKHRYDFDDYTRSRVEHYVLYLDRILNG